MKKITFISLICVLVFLIPSCSVKSTIPESNNEKINVEISGVAFYNLENLFDTINNENNDEEYLPNGANKWNTMKYKAKLHNMSYAISLIGLDVVPKGVAILGVSEIENRGVLEDLVKQPAIKDRSYQIVHYDSPDRRGVDVGLLYNPKLFIVTNSKSYRLNSPLFNSPTRDQLMVSGYLKGEKIHVIVNHWPSRIGGEDASRPRRNAAAALTRSIADSLFNVDPKAKIIIMGDLNDDPFNESCSVVLAAKKNLQDVKEGELYNPFWKMHEKGIGSLAYNDQWNLFDQIIISSQLARGNRKELTYWKSEVFNRNFLTQQEGRFKGSPLRTHAAGVWLNGYSDHYPTLIYLVRDAK
ncbi:MAG: endonuclease/exonuclease/phosphatase family protein [Paludibacter sp.]|nr:endonuclease/exonuclease/phosphatase family protein [Paludibacter sp.]